MAAVESRSKRNSGSNGTHPALAFPAFQIADWLPPGRPHMSAKTARAGLTGLDIMESWLTASRQMMDLWRESVREQQNLMLTSWRHQIVNVLAHDLTEEVETSQAAKRELLARTPGARSGEAQTAATRH